MNECERTTELHPDSRPRVPGEPRQGGEHQDGVVHPEDPRSSLTLMHLMQLFESAVTTADLFYTMVNMDSSMVVD